MEPPSDAWRAALDDQAKSPWKRGQQMTPSSPIEPPSISKALDENSLGDPTPLVWERVLAERADGPPFDCPDVRECVVCGGGVLCDEDYPRDAIVIHRDCAIEPFRVGWDESD